MRETSLKYIAANRNIVRDAAGTLFYLTKTVGDYYADDECY
jgi:hypothetical protein